MSQTLIALLQTEFTRVNIHRLPYITLAQVLQFKFPSYAVDFFHFGTLFVLDDGHTGRFYPDNFSRFAVLCQGVQDRLRINQENFLSHFQGYCTTVLWTELSCSDGIEHWVQWITRLMCECELQRRHPRVQQPPATVTFLSRDTLMLLYEILHIHRSFGYDFQSFFDLVQRAGEEMGLLDLRREELDEVAPLVVVMQFAKRFAEGFTSMMQKLDIPFLTAPQQLSLLQDELDEAEEFQRQDGT
ncbi:hypothetical protein PAPYR_2027 [Paratrimastix pyriformis]|uniref:Uncharacterized protein n=1 Tax=Paratrimastix pyriformis TaxID=342808 RepID=A0ABQ8UQL6_9EUKA|nr:hypothetical protein PAPYR_2027 [Paratrimastix pyriformis]